MSDKKKKLLKKCIIQIRATEEERSEWKKLADAKNLNVADFVRASIGQKLFNRVPTRKRKRRNYTPIDPALILQLNKIGVNLNQIARWCNQNKTTAETIEVISYLMSMHKMLEDLKMLNTSQNTVEEVEDAY